MNYETFKAEYVAAFANLSKYAPGQIGFNDYAAKLADLADAYPEFTERVEEEA